MGEETNNSKQQFDKKSFDRLTPIYPKERVYINDEKKDDIMKIINLVAPVARGQRGIVVSPVGSSVGTRVLLDMCKNIKKNHKDIEIYSIDIMDRLEKDDTDMFNKSNVGTNYIYNLLEDHLSQIKSLNNLMERIKRHAEDGKDAFLIVSDVVKLAKLYGEDIETQLKGIIEFFLIARETIEAGSVAIIVNYTEDLQDDFSRMVMNNLINIQDMTLYVKEENGYINIDILKSNIYNIEKLLSEKELEISIGLRRALLKYEGVGMSEDVIMKIIKIIEKD